MKRRRNRSRTPRGVSTLPSRCGEANYGAGGSLGRREALPGSLSREDLSGGFPVRMSVAARKWYKLIDIRHCNRIRMLLPPTLARQKKSICNVNAAAAIAVAIAASADHRDADGLWFLD